MPSAGRGQRGRGAAPAPQAAASGTTCGPGQRPGSVLGEHTQHQTRQPQLGLFPAPEHARTPSAKGPPQTPLRGAESQPAVPRAGPEPQRGVSLAANTAQQSGRPLPQQLRDATAPRGQPWPILSLVTELGCCSPCDFCFSHSRTSLSWQGRSEPCLLVAKAVLRETEALRSKWCISLEGQLSRHGKPRRMESKPAPRCSEQAHRGHGDAASGPGSISGTERAICLHFLLLIRDAGIL